MAVKIIGLIIGILVFCVGLYDLIKEKHDLESRKIYTIASVMGGVICAVCAVPLMI